MPSTNLFEARCLVYQGTRSRGTTVTRVYEKSVFGPAGVGRTTTIQDGSSSNQLQVQAAISISSSTKRTSLVLGCISSRSFIGWQSLDRSVENPGVLIPLGGPQAGGRAGLLRGTDRSLTVAAPFILAKAHGAPSRSRLGRLWEQTTSGPDGRPYDPSGKGLLKYANFYNQALATIHSVP